MKLEVVVIPVTDVDRAKAFYESLDWRLDADFADDHGFRIVQFTPPGSPCSIQFGAKVTTAPPGSATNVYLVVEDVQAARDAIAARGVAVSEVVPRGLARRSLQRGRAASPVPRRSARRTARSPSFSDPDDNTWLLQEITTRLPGRIDVGSDQLRLHRGAGGRAARASRPATGEVPGLVGRLHRGGAGRGRASRVTP